MQSKERILLWQINEALDSGNVKCVAFLSETDSKRAKMGLGHSIFKITFTSVIKAEFSASLLQSSVSHGPSEIILIC